MYFLLRHNLSTWQGILLLLEWKDRYGCWGCFFCRQFSKLRRSRKWRPLEINYRRGQIDLISNEYPHNKKVIKSELKNHFSNSLNFLHIVWIIFLVLSNSISKCIILYMFWNFLWSVKFLFRRKFSTSLSSSSVYSLSIFVMRQNYIYFFSEKS